MTLLENELYRNTLEQLGEGLPRELLFQCTFLVSGASGMLGSCLVDALMVWNRNHAGGCKVIALSRNRENAEKRFAAWLGSDAFQICARDVCEPFEDLEFPADYIIHAASNADPVSMAKYPADTLLANVLGTRNLLDYGRKHGMQRFLYVSSGEAYGQPDEQMSDFTEGYCGAVDLSDARSCYPQGKRAAEVLCQSYIRQYDVDAVIARPCHLFGPTMTARDSRAVSEFIRQAAAGKDIVLKSAGTLERSHCYVADAVSAMLLILQKGDCGSAYNIADRKYQMTIRAFAEHAAAAGGSEVRLELPSELESQGYSRVRRAVLAADKLEALGWKPILRTKSAIEETVEIVRSNMACRNR